MTVGHGNEVGPASQTSLANEARRTADPTQTGGKSFVMLQGLVNSAGRLFADLNRAWADGRRLAQSAPANGHRTPGRPPFQALKRITLTDEVGRTLFEEYAAHRKGPRGDEETGWVLLGLRERDEAVALATLPAGAARDAGVAHVYFNTNAQALASRIIRQFDRRLRMLGVVHTHPGSLRHPSDGDFRGDSAWVGQLGGGEGVFGIGTADNSAATGEMFARQLKPNVQSLGELRLSWYSLRHGDHRYRPLPYGLTLGPDLARPLHPVWMTIEHYAEQLERLYVQQAGISFEVGTGKKGPALSVNVPLAEPRGKVCVVLEDKEARYLVSHGAETTEVPPPDERIDRGVYLLLAELAATG